MAETLISIAQARERVLAEVHPLAHERVRIESALDRVLAEPVRAGGDVPPFASSAMDGYAVRAGPAGRRLSIVGEARAGAPAPGQIGEHEAIRISTGAVVPDGATAVIRQEDVRELADGRIETTESAPPGGNVRSAGEDMRAGTPLLEPGAVLRAAELGVAVAAGAGELLVSRRPVVSVLCTGDELRAPGAPLGPGEIHNSNGPMLAALASHAGALTSSVQRLADDREATQRGLAAALEQADVVIVSGGVSVGPHDHVKPALTALGVLERFWRVALQPGKPTWFGTRGATLVFGLPGNPVSAVVTFTLFAAPALAALLGRSPTAPLTARARLAVPVSQNPQREQALRVRLAPGEDGQTATPTGAQGSHLVTSLLGADALAMIPPGHGELAAGTLVALEPLRL
jgi:molybdopterin molybdotransferase